MIWIWHEEAKMNDFEKLLHGILNTTNSFWNARHIGRACHAPITEDLRIKAELRSTLVSVHGNSLKLTAINNKNWCRYTWTSLRKATGGTKTIWKSTTGFRSTTSACSAFTESVE